MAEHRQPQHGSLPGEATGNVSASGSPETEGRVCPGCEGEGEVLFVGDAWTGPHRSKVRPCPDCGGTGKVPHSQAPETPKEPCMGCGATGDHSSWCIIGYPKRPAETTPQGEQDEGEGATAEIPSEEVGRVSSAEKAGRSPAPAAQPEGPWTIWVYSDGSLPACGRCLPDPSETDMARIEVIPRSQLEATEKALGEIRRATNYDNAVGQLKKIERIADAALSQHTAEGEG